MKKNLRKKGIRSLLSLLLIVSMVLGSLISASAQEMVEKSIKLLHTDTAFTFAEGKWTAGNASHVWSEVLDSDNPRDTWYEVNFTGHKIDVYAGKNFMMGKVEYLIDGESYGVYDLYNGSNINSTLITTIDGLSEGEHTLRVEATGERNDSARGNHQIDCAEVVVYYYEKAAEPELKGSIVDTNLQYTQDKFDSVSRMDVKEATLSVWKNDTAVSQISLAAVEKEFNNVIVEASDFEGENGSISKENVTLTFIKSVQAYTGMPGYGSTTRPIPQGNRKEANEVLYQDAKEPITIAKNTLQNVWISVDVPKNTKAGTYEGTITVTADEADSTLTFAYTVEVADAMLADAEEFKDGFDAELWQNPYIIAEYYGVEPFSEEHFAILTPHMEKYKSIGGHAVTATIVDEAWSGQTYSANEIKYPSMVTWTKKSDGTWKFDYTDFDKWIRFNKELGIGDKIVCYSIAPWTNQVRYYDEGSGEWTWSNYSVGDVQYTSMWTAFLQDLMNHMQDNGWKDDTFIGIDERGFNAKAFDLIDSITGTDAKPFKTAGAMDGFVNKPDLAMRVDDLNVGSIAIKAHPTEFEQIRQKREDAGLRTTVYTCTGHIPSSFSLSAPGESYWTMMYSYSAGGEGFLRWAYDSWVEDPLRDTTHNAFEAGDCFLIFPDEKDSENPTSKSSLRLEKMAEGIRDVNKLIQMKREVAAMATGIDELLATVKAEYANDGLYVTEAGKATLASDMGTIKAQIAELTKDYIRLKADGTYEVESVSIAEGDKTAILLNETKQLHAVLKPDNLLNTNVTWSSDNENIAMVSNQGVITGVKVGTANIKATSVQDSSKSATIEITVERSKIPEDAKVAYYSFDEDAITDDWGNRDGENEGASLAEGKSGSAIEVADGARVVFPSNTTLTNEWSVGYWMYNAGHPEGRSSVLESSDGVRSFDSRVGIASNGNDIPQIGVHVIAGAGGYLTFANYTVPENEWIHVTWTQDKTNGLRLYVNGQFIQSNLWTVNNNFTAPIDVFGGSGFNGKLDEVKIYNRALTEDEVAVGMQVKGLNISQPSVELYLGSTHKIAYDLITDAEDEAVTFTSSDENIATVDKNGVVTPHKKGNAVITLTGGGYEAEVTVQVRKRLEIQYTIPQYELPEENLMDIEKAPGTDRQYLGQPDMVMLDDNKTLYTTYPVGHGCGPLVMQVSKDAGETWTEKTDIPESWADSYETPTMYKLNMTDGSTKLMMITGRPNWHGNTVGGWQTSVSDDGGETWSEYQTFHPTLENGSQNWTIVAMASLVQMKDEDGNYIDKWMGVYHNYNYVNYKTYLTFDEDGNEQWSAPQPYLDEYRDIEQTRQICEVGMFRSPDGKRIMALGRAQSHNHKSVMFYSDDEGETWSRPEDVQGALQGERHKAIYDPVSGRLVITFREIILDYNKNGIIENNDWMAGDWVAWVGTYEDLMEQNEGQYRILIDEDWANNAKSGDTGYAGIVALPDGTIITDSYGHWDKDFSLSWGGGVTTDLCYIRQAKFKLADIDKALGIETPQPTDTDKSDLKALIDYAKSQQGNADYEWLVDAVKTVFEETLEDAEKVNNNPSATQTEVDDAYEALLEKVHLLSFIGADTTKLDTLYNSLKEFNGEGYTEESAKAMKDALKEAKDVLDRGGNALKGDIENALKGLEEAQEGLQLLPVNKTKLKALIEKANDYMEDADKYISVADLETMLNSAIVIYNKADAAQKEVEGAYQALLNAIFGLREVPNKEALKDLLGKVAKMDLSQYTEESAKAVKAAYAAAAAVMEDPQADQAEVDEATATLERAVKGLAVDGKDIKDKKDEKVREKADNKIAQNTTGKTIATKKSANTGDAANAAIPAAAGLIAVLAAFLEWKKRLNA